MGDGRKGLRVDGQDRSFWNSRNVERSGTGLGLRLPFLLRGTIFVLLATFVATGAEAQERTALDGVYTEEQAARGATAFRSFCATCHTPTEFQGDFFQQRVGGDPVEWLFDYIRFSMPDDSPGSLSRQAYVDIMAYILELNEWPAGDEELPGASSELGQIHFPEYEEDPPADP